MIPCAIVVSAADREGSVDDDAQSAKSTPIKSKPTGAPHSHAIDNGGRGYALRKPATLYVLACALRPLHSCYPIEMEPFDSRWERDQRRRHARDNDEAAPKKCGRKSCETAADGKTPLVSTPRKRRGQFQWNLEPKKDGTTIDPTVCSAPSKKVRCML